MARNNVEKSLVGEEEEEEEKERALRRYREIISTLPQQEGWSAWEKIYQYQGFWSTFEAALEGVMWMQQRFKPRKEDGLLITLPKSGTTWFKSLLFSVMNRTRYHDFASTHPLLTANPHDLVPFLHFYLHQNIPFPNDDPDDDDDAPPRIFHTHIPFASFSQPMLESQCRIVYVCRNPKDVFVSLFHFMEDMKDKDLPPLSFERSFEQFCNGVSVFGPFWDHVLGYWKASLEWPERVMFVRYEDMKKNPTFLLKRLAEFVGCPFSPEEERGGVVNEILELCSFQKLNGLEANKTGAVIAGDIKIQKHTFFRKGKVGDWKRHLTPEMANRLDNIVDEKLAGSGLTFLDSHDDHHHST